jgi:hypothetical protein
LESMMLKEDHSVPKLANRKVQRPTAGARGVIPAGGARVISTPAYLVITRQNNGAGVPKLLLLMLTYLADGRDP